MKTVLIVEDEKMIRQGIKTMVQRSGVPVDLIMECNNGETALELLKEQDIDVMFTDIRMPKMDGITLVKEMQQCGHIPYTVAISGYDDFSYAVEMMRHGVCEYILKPVERDKIREILEKLEKKINDSREQEQSRIKIGFQQLKYMILNEDASQEEIDTLRQQYEENFFKGDYQISCFVQEIEEDEDDEEHIFLRDLNGQNIYMTTPERQEILRKTILEDCSAGFGGIHHGLEEIRTAFWEAYQQRKKAFCNCKTMTMQDEPPQIPEQMVMEAQKLTDEKNCLQRVQLLGTDKITELVNSWEKVFHEVRAGRIEANVFEQLMNRYLAEVAKTYRNILNGDTEQIEKLRDIWKYNDLDCYRDEFVGWLASVQDRINNQLDTNRNEQKIQQAVAYINENYNKDLNMAVVSNHLSMNYSLFSYSFKQYVGSNFVNYLKDIRMKEAKRLLVDTDMRVIEISQKVGYDNEKHFMKIFKSYCGVSPSEYRKNMRFQ